MIRDFSGNKAGGEEETKVVSHAKITEAFFFIFAVTSQNLQKKNRAELKTTLVDPHNRKQFNEHMNNSKYSLPFSRSHIRFAALKKKGAAVQFFVEYNINKCLLLI